MKRSFTGFEKIIFILGSICLSNSISYSQGVAKVQFIHNVADPAAAAVDVYLNDVLTIDDFTFRDATPYMDIPAGTPVKISIAPSTSTSSVGSYKDSTFTFNLATKYVVMASGVAGTGFQANPSSTIQTSIRFFLAAATKDITTGPTTTELNFAHGLTDAPPVDVLVSGGNKMVDNVGYGQFSGYKVLNPGVHTLYVTDYTNYDTIGTFSADLTLYGGQGLVVIASGFLNPATNNNGPAFGLFAVLPNGDVVPFTNVNIAGVFDKVNSFKSIIAYPVPSVGNITLEIHNEQAGIADIEVLNMYGQVVDPGKEVQLVAGKNQIEMNMSSLHRGEYLIKIVSTDRAGAVRVSIY